MSGDQVVLNVTAFHARRRIWHYRAFAIAERSQCVHF